MPSVAEKSLKDGEFPKNIVGARALIARKRLRPKKSQEDIAATMAEYGVNVDRWVVSRIERGERIALDYEIRALAAALYVPVSWLLAEETIWKDTDKIPPMPELKV